MVGVWVAYASSSPARLAGWLQVAILSLVCGALWLQVAFSGALAWKQAVEEIIICVWWFGGAWFFNSLYWAPWKTLKRSGALSKQKASI